MKSTPDESSPDASKNNGLWKLTLGCIGVVYGDIGTSPLYAFRESVAHVAEETGHALVREEVYGIISLLFWTLIISVTIKYVLFLLRIDNRGEGGSLSLMALARKSSGKWAGFVFFLGILGASLFYGEAAITPAISVMSAVEGLKLVTPAFGGYVLPISIFIMLVLFSVQKKGTGKVSAFFGPITTIWFLTIAALAVPWIMKEPSIMNGFNPLYGIDFLLHHGKASLLVLGSVFLVVTGTEALYVDLGHFGRKPIQRAWLYLVFPCLVINYMGQGALVLNQPEAVENTFYLLAPEWALIPVIGLATMATIIASQAVITGAYSVAQQAIQFGLLPRMEIRHTSVEHEGQIYMPKINRLLLVMVLLLCLIFRDSSSLASAYGIAVNGTMIVTTILAFIVIWKVWKKKVLLALAAMLPFFAVEATFMWGNLLKLFEGGFVPLFFAAVLMLLMWTWVKGTRYLYRQSHRKTVALCDLMENLDRHPPTKIEGTAIFLTSDPQIAPVAMLQNIKHNKILHDHNVILTVLTTHTPKVPPYQRAVVERLSSSMTRVILSFGYMETPDVPRALRVARAQKLLDVDLQEASYFLGKRSIVSSSAHQLQEELATAWRTETTPEEAEKKGLPHVGGLPEWQDHIYIALANSAVSATDFYRIPRSQVVEMGQQIAV